MNKEEAMKCRRAAQLYRALKQENEQLRQELMERERIDLRMNAEDAQVLAIVNAHSHPQPRLAAVATTLKQPFDFETAEIEPVDVHYKQISEPLPKRVTFLAKFALFVIIECAVWVAHHLGWVDLVAAMAISVFVFLLSNLWRT